MRRYAVLLYPEPEEGRFSVLVPALGIATHGDTVEECLANAREAIEGWLAAEADRGGELVEEAAPPVVQRRGSRASGGPAIRPDRAFDPGRSPLGAVVAA